MGEIVNQDIREERERFIQTLANKLSVSETANARLKNERLQLVEEVNSHKIRLTDANATIENFRRDSLTFSSLKERANASATELNNCRRELSKQADEFTMEKVKLSSKVERLELTVKAASSNELKMQATVAKLQEELNDKMQAERNSASEKFTRDNQVEMLQRDLKFERQRMGDLTQSLAEERGRSTKYGTSRNELKSECKRLCEENDVLRGRLEVSEGDVQELRSKFAAVGEQMEVMLATEAKDSGEAISAMQLKMRSVKEKMTEKLRASKQVQSTLRLEIKSLTDQLTNARRDTTMQIELNQRLTADLESTKAQSAATTIKMKNVEEKLAAFSTAHASATNQQQEIATVAQQFSDRMEEKARSIQIETEAKTKDLLKAKFEKRELEQQAKYQEMVTTMQNQYEQLAETRKAEAEAAAERAKRFENEYVLRSEHLREMEAAVSKALQEGKDKNALELEIQLQQCRETCAKESEVPKAELLSEIAELKRGLGDLEAERSDIVAELRKSEDNLERQVAATEQEKKARQLIGEHLEEGNMNVSRLSALLRTSEAEKQEMQALIEEEKAKTAEIEKEMKAALDCAKAAEAASLEAERKATEMTLVMKDLENETANAASESESLKAKQAELEKKLEEACRKCEDIEKQKNESVESAHKLKEELMAKSNENAGSLQALQSKLDEALRESKVEADQVRDSKRDLEVKLVQKDGEIEKFMEKCKRLEDIESMMKAELQKKEARLSTFEKEVCEVKDEEKHLERTVTKKQNAILEVQRIIDRKLLPVKHDLSQLQSSIGSEIKGIEKDALSMVKSVHDKWSQRHSAHTRRLSQHYERELANVRASYELQKETDMSKLSRHETDQKNTLVASKDKEIADLQSDLRQLREKMQQKVEKDSNETKALHHSLDAQRTEMTSAIENIKVEKAKGDGLIRELRTKVKDLETSAGKIALEKSQWLSREEEMRNQIEGYKARLEMIVVCLESEFKFGGNIEEGLLDNNEVHFRSALRELTDTWAKKCEELKVQLREPLEKILEEKKEELRRVVTELGACDETRVLAQDRVAELEADNGKLEAELEQLREEASDLQNKSIMVDDLERSRSEVAMLAELQRIEGESKERGLKGEMLELKRKYEEKLRALERKMSTESWEKEEKFRSEVKALKAAKSDLILQHEKILEVERLKIREVEDDAHRKEVSHQRKVNALEVRIMGLQNEIERTDRRGFERELLVMKENIDIMDWGGGDSIDAVNEGNAKGRSSSSSDDIQAKLAQIESMAISMEESSNFIAPSPEASAGTEAPEGHENVTKRRRTKEGGNKAEKDNVDVELSRNAEKNVEATEELF